MIKRTAALTMMLGVGCLAQAQMPAPLLDQKAAPAATEAPPAPPTPDIQTVVGRYGAIVDSLPVGVGGLTAWTVEKNGRRVVLYTTADGQALISGIVWEAASGRNVSDAFNRAGAVGQTAAPPAAAMEGPFPGPIPESMQTVDTLLGVKEGQGGITDTVYIIDPRCPFCRQAYNNTREYVRRGASIKWIPTVALGDPGNGIPLAAALLQSPAADTMDRVLGQHESIKTAPTPETEQALRLNLAFMMAAFEQNGVAQAGVPVAFFLDHRTGKPRMMTGLSEPVVLEDIFGKLPTPPAR